MSGFYGDIHAKKRIKSTDAKQRLKWYEQHLAMKDQSLFSILEWRFVGPEIMSGRITDVAIPPGRKYTIYAATASGGVWKTENQGTTWEPIFEHAPSTSIGDIAIDPDNPAILWVGTGEANIFRSSMSGTGIYKSTDTGKTWQHMGLSDSHHIARIVIHPEDPDIVYLAASGHEYTYNEERGVFKTSDGGKTWQKVLYINEKTGIIDLVMDPSDSNTLYASAWDRIRRAWNDPKPGENDAVYKTTNGGRTWQKITIGFPDLNFVGRIGLDVARSNPDVIYALIDNHEPARAADEEETDAYGRQRGEVKKGAEVYRSDDRGESWTKVSEPNRNIERLFSTYGWVFGQIRVDPNDENTVYIMGIPLLKSTDGGKTFESLTYTGLHVDHHALWIDPDDSNYLVNGNDGGVNISYDGGKTWVNYQNLGAVQFYNVAVDMADPFNVYGSIQDNGCYRGPVTHRPGRSPIWEWESIPGGEASYLAIDPSNPDILYNEGFYGRIRRSELIHGKWETTAIVPEAGEGEPKLRGQWLAPFLLSPHNPEIIYHGMQYLFRSMDRGDSWERISHDLTYNNPKEQGDISFATITTISESPFKFGLIYVGTDDGKVHVTRNSGHEWTEIMKGLPYKKWVSRIVASAYDEATVYLSMNGKRDNDFADYLYKSIDFGKTWVDISANIPGGPINVIKEDVKNKNILYVGTDLGVYITLNRGKSWQVLANNLPTTFVHDLVIHPRDDILVAATHGRGMWVLDAEYIQKCFPEIIARAVHLFDPDPVKLPERRRRRVAPKAEFYYFLQNKESVSIAILNESDELIKKLEGTGHPGLNSTEWDLTRAVEEAEDTEVEEKAYVEPGIYKIRLTAGATVLEATLEVN
jgi:photosystem II stability/assembly factor-like uncharacterized protein